MPDECWEGYKKVLIEENYPETGVCTKWGLIKEFIKQNIKCHGKRN
jgi:hypothetical protein